MAVAEVRFFERKIKIFFGRVRARYGFTVWSGFHDQKLNAHGELGDVGLQGVFVPQHHPEPQPDPRNAVFRSGSPCEVVFRPKN